MRASFPILACKSVKSVPWALAERARDRLFWSHGQTLERLAERGGLLPTELVAALDGLEWPEVIDLDRAAAERRLVAILEQGNGANAAKNY